ncbi:MarR family transcriptional regulator [Hymenobacter lutimineralis]|uniref:MarR family transcriptional regulator n=1 Tax=Hymenobacter lutimineralis TaxID=2606448 RepID=A0A5D6UZ18_9BACT|nr:MarR family transcriptional regulator [Hymenobacter lutimineralis]TYZ08038.1 MarR family transcriptional regulator [Hymenobacter lutimineralis]
MLSQIIFYSIDRAIRTYRKLAQANIDRARIAITIDQWLVLQVIEEDQNLTQTEIAERVLKDQASVARMIALLLKQGLLTSEAVAHDARRTRLRVTPLGTATLAAVEPVVLSNRAVALQGISDEEVATLRRLLDRIYLNCAS